MTHVSDRDGQQGPSSPGGQGGNPAGGRLTSHGEDLARELWGEVRHGAQHFSQRGGRTPPGRVRQFFHGLSLPFHIARALLADPVARGRYLRVSLLQTAAAVLLVVTYLGSCKKTAEFVQEEARGGDEAQEEAIQDATKGLKARQREAAATARRVEEAQAAADRALRAVGVTPPPRPSRTPDAGGSRPEAAAAEASAPGSEDAGARLAEDTEAGALRPAGPGTAEPRDAGVAATPGPAASEAEARLAQRIRDVEAAAQGRDAGTSLVEAIAALALEAAALEEGDDAPEDAAAPPLEDGGTAVAAQGTTPQSGEGASGSDDSGLKVKFKWGDKPLWDAAGFSLWNLAFWAWLLTALQVAQWVVIALSREYHDAIARDASLLTGVEPEDEEATPRVRLNMGWVRKKVKRRWRAFMLFAVGMPVVWLLAIPFFCSSTLASILSTAWAAWWLVVFTAAKSSHAWELPAVPPRPPWFLRAWTWATTRVPGLRWGLLKRYGAFWARRTEEVRAPIATAERHPWAFAGLALVRFLGALPPMKFFLRPVIPVASAHLLAEEAAARSDQQPPAPRPVIPAGETGS